MYILFVSARAYWKLFLLGRDVSFASSKPQVIKKACLWFHTFRTRNIYALLTKREVKMAGYWLSSFFAFLLTETKSRSIKTQKKNEANIQPS